MSTSMTNITLLLVLPLTLIISIFLFGNAYVGESQTLSNNSPSLQQQGATMFQSISDSFNIIVPHGWSIEEIDSTDTDTLLGEILQGSRLVAQLCPEQDVLLDSDDGNSCDESNQRVYLQRYPNLSDEPEFDFILNGSKKANQAFLDYDISRLEQLGYTDINIVHNAQIPINVIDSDTNKTSGTVQANFLEMRYNNA